MANLSCHRPSEESDEYLDDIKKLISYLSKLLVNGLSLGYYSSYLLLVSRLANHGDGVRKLLRESLIPGLIVDIIILNKKLMNPYETGRLCELAVDCFVSMVG